MNGIKTKQHIIYQSNYGGALVHCRDVGFDCDGIVRAETEEDVLQHVARHAQMEHGLETVTEEIVAKVKSVIREE